MYGQLVTTSLAGILDLCAQEDRDTVINEGDAEGHSYNRDRCHAPMRTKDVAILPPIVTDDPGIGGARRSSAKRSWGTYTLLTCGTWTTAGGACTRPVETVGLAHHDTVVPGTIPDHRTCR